MLKQQELQECLFFQFSDSFSLQSGLDINDALIPGTPEKEPWFV